MFSPMMQDVESLDHMMHHRGLKNLNPPCFVSLIAFFARRVKKNANTIPLIGTVSKDRKGGAVF